MVAVRFASGVVGETRRQAHLASVPAPGATHEFWTTFCGMHIPVEVAEVSQGPDGMPCLPCLMHSAAGTGPAVEAGDSCG
ncbi:hypothetical protein DFQ14_102290 [Halopolyspora algeriensis]|uniref:Uncharacterized protein n=1 Tax=Halopolyspora algeriensis TaxID=1500506 RepID=A0A368W1X5_9ACTN|nr:hypothetical protein [Halopolyspora algeriensis]RCW45988.1 hypothetical protein DFQ14_102290 [Halopolyspora algeriensis]TQM55401.1 hypothetical protein FHU43_0164 [Halopolyspora algeriensis]